METIWKHRVRGRGMENALSLSPERMRGERELVGPILPMKKEIGEARQ
jgi:hypothetical protein